ncbi:MAG: tyrosine-type recombinase/integrase [Anaerovoracaceae bacterium]
MKIYKHTKTFTYDGKRYVVRADNLEDLYYKLAEKKQALISNTLITENKSFEVWAWEWLAIYKEKSISDVTYAGYKTKLEKIILPLIGKIPLKKLKAIHCQEVLNSLEGYSKTYIMKTRQILYQVCKKAVSNNYMLTNPAEDLSIPKAVDGTGRPLTSFEKEILLIVIKDHPNELWIKTMLYCGLRPGEIPRIKGKHINYGNQILLVDGTKTVNAKRYVPLSSELIALFEKRNAKPDEMIFPLLDTKVRRKRAWHKIWNEMNMQAGAKMYRGQILEPFSIPKDCVPYCCRHSFATECKDALIPRGIIKELMGHANRDVTDRYMHSTERSLELAALMLKAYRTNTPIAELGAILTTYR